MNEKILQRKLEDSFKKFKGNTAIEHGKTALTYGELDRKSNLVRNVLIDKGIPKETFIGVLTDNRTHLIAAMIGIFKASCVFIPLTPEFPDHTLEKMLRSIDIKIIISDEANIQRLTTGETFKAKNLTCFHLEQLFLDKNGDNETHKPGISYDPEDRIYVYFTSGTTGIPRGFIGKNRSLLHFIDWQIETFKIDESFRFAQFVNIGFDAFLRDVLTPLCAGGTICIPEYFDTIISPDQLKQWVDVNRINAFHCVPSLFKLLSTDLPGENIFTDLKFVFLSGEKLSPPDLREWYDTFGSRIQLVNFYGTSETTMSKTYYLIKPDDLLRQSIPVGKPIKGARVIILDRDMKICDDMVSGEIYIRTPYRTRGYVNDPVLTHERFIPNPFNDNPDDVIYKTGDLGRFLPDGNIDYIGRIDRQVKVQGIRVELEGIENKLKEYSPNIFPVTEISQNLQQWQEPGSERICCQCLLSSAYPGIDFDENGVCSICREYEGYKKYVADYFQQPRDFAAIVRKAREKSNSQYDCLLLFSGGKDSTYVLYRLVDMGLKVLAFTFDNGYISKTALENIKRVTSHLQVESIICKIDRIKEIFLESLKSEHTVCTGCFKALTMISTEIACKKSINLVITGLSRGQIIELRLQGMYSQGIFEVEEIQERLPVIRKMYHATTDKVTEILGLELQEDIFNNIHFVDFFRYDNTPIQEIMQYLQGRDQYWRQPEDTGFCSSNCLINDVGIFIHRRDTGYHNYAVPLSWDCRLGIIRRESGMRELQLKADPQKIHRILNQLGYFSPEIKEAVVLENEDKTGEKYLCAYFTAHRPIDGTVLRDYLLSRLPAYMIPQHFIQLEKIPLTPNGKVDRKALTAIQLKNRDEYVAPGSRKEKILVKLWSEILDTAEDELSVTASLFDLGINSLKVLTLIARIHKEFEIRVSLGDIFKNPTIKKQVELLKEAAEEIYTDINPPEKKEYYEASAAQKRFYLQNQMEGDNIGYNMTQVMKLEGELEREKLENALKQLIRRHESLRTSFELIGHQVVQRVHHTVQWQCQYFEAAVGEADEIIEKFMKPFDLSKAPLLAAGIIKTGKAAHIMMTNMHHIISDGTSMAVLVGEFTRLYNGLELPGLRLQYKDFSRWQNSPPQQAAIAGQEDFWLNQFETRPPVLNLPTDYPRREVRQFTADLKVFTLGADETKALKELALEEEATLFMVLLALYNILLSKLSGQEDIVVGTGAKGRRHVDLENIIGLFFNTLVLRNYPAGEMTFKEFLEELKSRTMEAFENQDYAFDQLVRKLADRGNLKRDASRHPLFDTIFSLDDFIRQPGQQSSAVETGLKQLPYHYVRGALKVDLELSGSEIDNKLVMALRYSTALFKENTILEIIKHYRGILHRVLENKEIKLKEIPLSLQLADVNVEFADEEYMSFQF